MSLRHVGAEAIRPQHAALNPTLAQEVYAVQFDLDSDRGHAYQRRGAIGSVAVQLLRWRNCDDAQEVIKLRIIEVTLCA